MDNFCQCKLVLGSWLRERVLGSWLSERVIGSWLSERRTHVVTDKGCVPLYKFPIYYYTYTKIWCWCGQLLSTQAGAQAGAWLLKLVLAWLSERRSSHLSSELGTQKACSSKKACRSVFVVWCVVCRSVFLKAYGRVKHSSLQFKCSLFILFLAPF